MFRQVLLAAAASLLTGTAEPHPSTGRIEGTVRDSAGAPIANVQVIVVSRPWTAMSDSAGTDTGLATPDREPSRSRGQKRPSRLRLTSPDPHAP